MTDDNKSKEASATDEQTPEGVDADQNHWRHMKYIPTDEDRTKWQEVGVPPDSDIVGGFLMNNPLVWGVPDKAEIFRLADTVEPRGWNPQVDYENAMHLRYCKPSYAFDFELIHPHLTNMSPLMEHNYVVRLQAVTDNMVLTRIKVLHGSRTDDSKAVVFEGTEYPGPMSQRLVRVIRVTVHESSQDVYATHEIVADTIYPNPLF